MGPVKENLVGRGIGQAQDDCGELSAGELWSSRGRRGAIVIECGRGRLWITAKGDRQDYLLKPGERWQGDARSMVVAEALEDSQICVHRAA